MKVAKATTETELMGMRMAATMGLRFPEMAKEINEEERYCIPTSMIGEAEAGFRYGDVVGICTSIEGLDIMHVGILIRQDRDWHLLHASSREQKVVISSRTLKDYLEANAKSTGIILMRPL
jgi:hypothetical protein